MIVAAKNAKNVKLDESWILMYNKYGYDSYDFYTQNKSYYKAKQIRDKLSKAIKIMSCILLISFFTALILCAINYGNKADTDFGLHNFAIFVLIIICASIVGLSLLAIGIINYFYEKYYERHNAYFKSEEYKKDLKEVGRLDKIAFEKEKEEKANDLIIVYEALDDKKLSRQKKIKIIKDKIK